MKRLSLKRSLELCKELWSWLRDNPNEGKLNWPKWGKYTNVENHCFACEFDFLQNKKNDYANFVTCHFCPLKGLWDDDCTKSGSPYMEWCDTNEVKIKQKNAGIIADFCDKELKRLAKKGG